ncbi:hypothetical protein PGT21_036389 [Puccinia graminis f. sp. tritici]|uniref:Uncharacterized protein n=1 Tax=Puccinia graminis f. sp. tritici TaxID=56615 RepID=A0A5B0QD69_PUCGR|nr:hypothetical protein PGT21_036389 [Puccinia graminis f. sp. tritici]
MYCARKNKQKKTVWSGVRSKVKISISFNCHTIDLPRFKELVTLACGKRHPNAPPLIDHGTNSSPPTMLWVAYMARNPKWLKTGSQSVATGPMFADWMQDIIKGGVKKGGLHLKMDNPSDNKSLAADNDLMAQTVCRHAAQMATLMSVLDKHPSTSADGPPGAPLSQTLPLGQTPFDLDDDAEDSCDESFDAQKIIEEEIFRKYSGNIGVDPSHSVYPHPTDVNWYVILTAGNHGKVKGVSLTSPPSCVKFYNRKTRKSTHVDPNEHPVTPHVPPLAASANRPDASPPMGQIVTLDLVASIVEICTETISKKQARSPESSSLPVGVAGSEGQLLDYVKFAGVANPEETMRVLERNEVDSYTMFAEGFFTPEQLQQLGLTVGTLAKLCRNKP